MPGLTMAGILDQGPELIDIHACGTIDIIPGVRAGDTTPAIKARALSNALDQLPVYDDAIVLIENQYKASGEGVVTEHFLTYHYRNHRIVSMDPNKKLDITFSDDIKRHYTYGSNKAFAVDNLLMFNARHNMFNTCGKIDDMADAFMQLLAHALIRPDLQSRA